MRRRTIVPRRQAKESSEATQQLSPEEARSRTFQHAVKLLAGRPYSVEDLRERLQAKSWADEEIVDSVLLRLKEYGYLNDERFAFGYASYRIRQSPIGRQRLMRDLTMKKVERKTAEAALDLAFQETSEEDLIDRAIAKRIRLRGRPRTRTATKSLFDHLLRQGFTYELIVDKVRAISAADLDEETE